MFHFTIGFLCESISLEIYITLNALFIDWNICTFSYLFNEIFILCFIIEMNDVRVYLRDVIYFFYLTYKLPVGL